MAEYSLSARLRAVDAGFTSTIQRAQRETQRLESTAAKLKNDAKLKMQVGVEGLARIERLKGAIEAARQSSSRPLSVRLQDAATRQLDKIRAELNSLTSKAHNIAVNIKTNGGEKLKGIKNSISEGVSGAAMGAGATMLGTAGIGFSVVNAVQSQMDFEKQMSAVKAVLSGTYSGEELDRVHKELTAAAEYQGATTKFTAAQAAQGQYYMAMAGWKEQQIKEGLPALVNLAAAGDLDMKSTSDILTDDMTAFGLKAGEYVKINGKIYEQSQHFGDMMAATFSNANTDIQQMGQAAKFAAPLVQSMYANGSDEDKMLGAQDAFLAMGLMANNGIKDTQAGTSLRAMFTRLAAMQRNAHFAHNALGVDFVDEGSGEVRRLKDMYVDFRKAFKEGVDMDKVTDFFEQLSGEKVHADTRRKLEGYYESAMKNGGKLTGPEKLKMASMLAGQEAMSGWLGVFLSSEEDFNKINSALENCEGTASRIADMKMDNLAGSFTYLSSAWDAFQRSFVKGEAGQGLRAFVDSVTDSLSKANQLFADGVDFSDLVALGSDAVNKLKNKFLELDGIGSVLAGGALFMALKKLANMALGLKNMVGGLKVRGGTDISTRSRSDFQSVGTMTIHAGVVNLNGAVKGGVSANQQRVNEYYARRQQILSSGTTSGRAIPPPATGRFAALKGLGGAIAGTGAMAAVFGALDMYSARSTSEYTNSKAEADLNTAREELKTLRAQGADVAQIQSQVAKINAAEQNVRAVAELNRQNERRTGAGTAGMLAGTLAGAAIGSVVPVIGTAVGAMIGGVLGQFGGTEIFDRFGDMQFKHGSKKTWRDYDEDVMLAKYSVAQTRRAQADEVERKNRTAKTETAAETVAETKSYFSSAQRRRQSAVDTAAEAKETEKAATLERVRKFQAKESLKNAGYTSLWQDTTQTPDTFGKIEQMKKAALGETESARQSAFSSFLTSGREFVNLNKNAAEKFAKTFAQGKNYSQQSATIDTTAGLTEYSKAHVDAAKSIEQFKKQFEGAKFNNAATFDTTAGFSAYSMTQADTASSIADFKSQYEGAQFDTQPMAGVQNSAAPAVDYSAAIAGFESAKSSIATFATDISTGFSEGFESAKSSIATFATDISTSFTEGFESAKSAVSSFTEEFASNFSAGLSSLAENATMFSENLSVSFTAAFESISAMTAETFSSLSTTISGGVETARAVITETFTSASVEVQAVWGAIPGFFSGIFSSLGGIAAGAGSAIAAGINSGIGMIQSAWEALSGWLSSKIASLASMASSAAASIGIGSNAHGTASWRGGLTEVNEHGGEIIILPNGQQITPYQTLNDIAHNAKGTSFFSGGWSEVNEHGGEIMYLPTGTRIIPHATTVRILREQIKEKLNDAETVRTHDSTFDNVGNAGVPRGNIFQPSAKNIRSLAKARADIFGKEKLNENRTATTDISSAATFGRSAANSIASTSAISQQRRIAIASAELNRRRNSISQRAVSSEGAILNDGSSISTADISRGLVNVNDARYSILREQNATARRQIGTARATFNRYSNSIFGNRTKNSIQLDELGNLKNANIPEYNRINADDSITVRRAKRIAQMKYLNAAQSGGFFSSQNSATSKTKTSSFFNAQNSNVAQINSPAKSNFDFQNFYTQALKYLPPQKAAGTFQPKLTTAGTFPTSSFKDDPLNKLAQLQQFIPQKFSSDSTNIFGGVNSTSAAQNFGGGLISNLVNIWRQAKSGDLLNFQPSLTKNFGGDLLNNFGTETLGDLPNLQLPQLPQLPNSNSTATSNSTTNSNSHVNFNFGGVNINSGMDFDSFAHKLTQLFTQGADNSVLG